MKKLGALMIVLMICVGCAGPQLNDSDMGAIGNMTSGGIGDVKYFVRLMRTYKIPEGKEVRKGYEFLPIYGESTKLKDDTLDLSLSVRILNPKKQEYSLWETVHLAYADETYPYQITHQFYSGELSVNEFVKVLPLNRIESATYWLAIKGRNGESMFEIGPVKYQVGGN